MLTQKEGHEKNDQTQNQKKQTNKQKKQLRVGQDYTDEIITVWSPV